MFYTVDFREVRNSQHFIGLICKLQNALIHVMQKRLGHSLMQLKLNKFIFQQGTINNNNQNNI